MDGQLGVHKKQIPPKFLGDGNRTFLADKIRVEIATHGVPHLQDEQGHISQTVRFLAASGKRKACCAWEIASPCSTS
jgi:hypothetical protein